MRILMINVVCGIRSTGRICTDIASSLESKGYEVKIAYGREEVPEKDQKYAVKIGLDKDVKLHGVKARFLDASGWGSKRATVKFISWVKKYNPDVIHLHNIHGYYINVDILFNYLKNCGKKIIWTLHDCWSFTGHAAFCELANCERWIEGCYNCPKKNEYPKTFLDRSRNNWKKKKELFVGVPNLVIVTPSKWLSDLVKKSFLKDYEVRIIYNGIDDKVFHNIENTSFKKQYGIEGKIIVLGVAAVWNERKGLKDFLKLRSLLDDSYQIVLVGLSTKQIEQLPNGITGIEKTNSVEELAEIYSASDVFVNPTYEDNYPTTNLESIACGTPVITYDTGGSAESAEGMGFVTRKKDPEEIYKIICNNSFSKSHISNQKRIEIPISKTMMVDEYVKFYESIL